MARSNKKTKKTHKISISRKANKRIIILIIFLIAATFVWTSNQVDPTSILNKIPVLNQNQNQNQLPETTTKTTTTKADDDFYIKTNGALELPYYNSDTFIIDNLEGRYRMLYDTATRSAKWVAYLLTTKDVETPSVGRSNSFKSDSEVIRRGWPTASDKNYTHSGYDRGHLLPSADRDDSREENQATFLLSNVAPQKPNLNRKVWKTLEDQVRRWAAEYDSIYVVVGTIYASASQEINGGIDIPSDFYKALLVKQNEQWYSQAYLMPNIDSPDKDYNTYALSVDNLESKIGLDLFYNLDDAIEKRVEAQENNSIFKK